MQQKTINPFDNGTASRVTCASMLLLAVLFIMPGLASAQWGGPVKPHLAVGFRLKLSPDAEAARCGAVTFYDQVDVGGDLWFDQFTGNGCVLGPFEPSIIYLHGLSAGHGYPFKVTCRSRSKEDAVSSIEWIGKLDEGTISGDVWITLSGQALTPSEFAAKRIDRVAMKRKVPWSTRKPPNGPLAKPTARIPF